MKGFCILAQKLLLSPRKVCHLMWNRTVNTSGRVGKTFLLIYTWSILIRKSIIMIQRLGSNVLPGTLLQALAVVDTVRFS